MRSFSFFWILFFFSWISLAQEKTPFATYDFSADQEYLKQLNFLKEKPSTKNHFNDIVLWATAHKDYETVISYYSKLIDLDQENPLLYFQLAGAYGIRIDEISKFNALPYVSAMKSNFLKAHELDPKHTPTLMALVQVYAKLPGFLGGSFEKAKYYSDLLYEISTAEGLIAQGFILESQGETLKAKEKFTKAFVELSFLEACNSKINELYFRDKSQNLSYQIGSIGLYLSIDIQKSICALNYYLNNFNEYDNLPKEWVSYKLSLLYEKIKEKEKAVYFRNLTFEINPKFKPQ